MASAKPVTTLYVVSGPSRPLPPPVPYIPPPRTEPPGTAPGGGGVASGGTVTHVGALPDGYYSMDGGVYYWDVKKGWVKVQNNF